MIENSWLPALKAAFPIGTYMHRIVRLFDVAESDAADRLAPIEATFPPAIDISYLPRIDGLWLEFSVNGDFSTEEAEEMLAEAVGKVRPVFGNRVYAEGSTPLEVLLGEKLKAKGLTIAVAESLTGGSLAAKIVSVSGASAYFRGSVTAYSTEIKTSLLGIPPELIEKEGVVSEAVALMMAQRVRELLGADIGIGTTGVAEVSNATLQGETPHAWIGYADGKQQYAQFRKFFYRDRTLAIDKVVCTALYFALRENA
jgi:nicotinamide-nucleotide amidase